ncbi:energy transducer TonB [Agrilutibacter solisilvae]|uniref:Energy transducer TonB n=1 Tax=Agrilutibacter solisilvae TaxID=2763317 RepID=A0A974XZX4_9GAMM|nr:energy transducer TonB [Lysobacter solisilvae]QSX78703.1 energy transducer TonB [Lysobacter solisilvae]
MTSSYDASLPGCGLSPAGSTHREKRMTVIRWVVLLLAAVCGASAAAESRPTDIWLLGSIGVDEQGGVTQLEWRDARTPLHGLIAERITPRVRSWEFIPASIDGKPAPTQTGLAVHLQAQARADGSLDLRFVSARTGPMGLQTPPPGYPGDAARGGVSATVTVDVTVGADGTGSVKDMRFDGHQSRANGYRKSFFATSTQALKTWVFQPEIVGGRSVPTIVSVPIVFCLSSACTEREVRKVSAVTQQEDALPSHLYMADSSEVALKTKVQGTGI